MDKRIGYRVINEFADVTIPPAMVPEFKQLVRRATATWQDISPEMRDFADRVAGMENIVGQNMKHGHSTQVKDTKSKTLKDLISQANSQTHPENR